MKRTTKSEPPAPKVKVTMRFAENMSRERLGEIAEELFEIIRREPIRQHQQGRHAETPRENCPLCINQQETTSEATSTTENQKLTRGGGRSRKGRAAISAHSGSGGGTPRTEKPGGRS